MLRLLTSVSLLLPFIFSSVFAQDKFAQDKDKDKQPPAGACAQYGHVAIPASELPTAQDRTTLASCDAVKLYFGIDTPADPVAARKCAYLEREQNQARKFVENVLGGAMLLSMVYANGKGADRNFDLALKFACEVAGYEGGTDTRVNHLLDLQKKHWAGNDFSVCDDINDNSGNTQLAEELLACSQVNFHFEQDARTARIDKLTTRWTPEQKKALADLQRLAEAFFQARGENEIQLPTHGAGAGTYAEAMILDARSSLADDFVAALERFEQGQLPNFSAAQFKQADAQLNKNYKQILSERDHPDPEEAPSNVSSEGIRTAQRAWLPYREAWVALGKLKYPSVTAESWRTWLTQDRIKLLSEP